MYCIVGKQINDRLLACIIFDHIREHNDDQILTPSSSMVNGDLWTISLPNGNNVNEAICKDI